MEQRERLDLQVKKAIVACNNPFSAAQQEQSQKLLTLLRPGFVPPNPGLVNVEKVLFTNVASRKMPCFFEENIFFNHEHHSGGLLHKSTCTKHDPSLTGEPSLKPSPPPLNDRPMEHFDPSTGHLGGVI